MLSEAQISEFRETGVIVVESAYSTAALEPLRRQHQAWIDESRQHDGPFGEMLDGRPRFDVEPGHCAASPEEISPDFLNLIERGPMLEAVADLLGDDLRFHHAKLNSKLPGSVAEQCERQAIEYLGPAGSLCLMHTRSLHASAENQTQRSRSLYIATLTAVDAMPLVPCAVPSVYAGRIVHGRDPGRIRSIAFSMENPEIPSGASFFDQQAGN